MKNFKKSYVEYFENTKMNSNTKNKMLEKILYKQNNNYLSYKKTIILTASLLLILTLTFSIGKAYANKKLLIEYDSHFSYQMEGKHIFKVNIPINENYKNPNKNYGKYTKKDLKNSFNIDVLNTKYNKEEKISIKEKNNEITLNISKIYTKDFWAIDKNIEDYSYISINGYFTTNNKNITKELETFYGNTNKNHITINYNQNLGIDMYIIRAYKGEHNGYTGIRNIYFIYKDILYSIKFSNVSEEIVWEFINSLN